MLTRSRFNAKFTRKLNRRKSRIELVSDFFFTFSFPKRYAKACRRLDRRTIERTYEDWSLVFNPETYARTKEIGSQAVMNRVFAKNDEDVTLIFGVSRRDGSSGKIYQASRCPSLFLLPFRGCVYETADHSLVLVSLPRCTVETCFERITGTERIRASRKSLSYSPSLFLRDLHTILDRENPSPY